MARYGLLSGSLTEAGLMEIIATQQIGQAAPWQATQTAALGNIVATAYFHDRQQVGRSEPKRVTAIRATP